MSETTEKAETNVEDAVGEEKPQEDEDASAAIADAKDIEAEAQPRYS